MSTPAAAAPPARPMSSQDLAGFVLLLFWMNDPTAANFTPYATFNDQVAGIQAAVLAGTIPNSKLIMNIQTMNADSVIGPAINQAQIAVGTMIQAILAAGLWDACSTVSMDQVSQIAQLP